MALPAQLFSPKSVGGAPTNPYGLGSIKPVVAGTALKLTNNFTDADNRVVNWCRLRADDANLGRLYIVVAPNNTPPWTLPGGTVTSGADLTNWLNVIHVMNSGDSYDIPFFILKFIRLGQIYVDCDAAHQNSDFLIGAAGEQ